MLIEQVHVLVAELLTEHLFDTLGEQTAVQTNEALFRKFTDQGRDVLVLHVSIGIELRTLGSIGSLHVVHHEIQTTLGLAILGVTLTIEDERFRYLIISLRHECNLYLVLDILNGQIVMYSQVRKDSP